MAYHEFSGRWEWVKVAPATAAADYEAHYVDYVDSGLIRHYAPGGAVALDPTNFDPVQLEEPQSKKQRQNFNSKSTVTEVAQHNHARSTRTD